METWGGNCYCTRLSHSRAYAQLIPSTYLDSAFPFKESAYLISLSMWDQHPQDARVWSTLPPSISFLPFFCIYFCSNAYDFPQGQNQSANGACSSCSHHGQPGSTEHRLEPGWGKNIQRPPWCAPTNQALLAKGSAAFKIQLPARNRCSTGLWGAGGGFQTQPITVTNLLFSPGLLTLL